MKKIFVTLTMFVLSAGFLITAACQDRDEKKINYKDLPAVSRTFVERFFDQNMVKRVIHDLKEQDYEVYMSDGSEITFNKAGEWIDVDTKSNPFPMQMFDLLPPSILSYLNDNYPNNPVDEVSLKSYGYEVSLGSTPDTDVKFDKDGKFISVD